MSISKDVCYSEEVLLPPAKVSSCKGWLFNLSKTSSKWEIIDSSTFLTVLATKLNLQVFSSFNYGYSFHTFQKSLSSLSKISKAAIYSEQILSNDFHAPHVPLFLSLTHFDTICDLLLNNNYCSKKKNSDLLPLVQGPSHKGWTWLMNLYQHLHHRAQMNVCFHQKKQPKHHEGANVWLKLWMYHR